MRKLKYFAPLLIAIACFGFQQARATTTYTLSVGNPDIAGYPGPYGSVSVSLSGGVATITFTANQVGAFQYMFGDGGTVGVNVNNAYGAWTFNGVTSASNVGGAFFTPGPYSDGGAGNEDGFGSFNQTINSFDGFQHSATTVTFTLTGNWASDAVVLAPNASGNRVAAHIFIANYPDYTNTNVTGYATEGGNVPDGGTTVMLLGVALGALGMARRYLMS